MSKAVTYQDVLYVLSKNKDWTYMDRVEPSTREVISKTEFKRILLDDGITTSLRTCSSMWSLLLEFGFFTKINKSDSVYVNLFEVQKIVKPIINTTAVHAIGSVEGSV